MVSWRIVKLCGNVARELNLTAVSIWMTGLTRDECFKMMRELPVQVA